MASASTTIAANKATAPVISAERRKLRRRVTRHGAGGALLLAEFPIARVAMPIPLGCIMRPAASLGQHRI